MGEQLGFLCTMVHRGLSRYCCVTTWTCLVLCLFSNHQMTTFVILFVYSGTRKYIKKWKLPLPVLSLSFCLCSIKCDYVDTKDIASITNLKITKKLLLQFLVFLDQMLI
jgi:hypothetical protein